MIDSWYRKACLFHLFKMIHTKVGHSSRPWWKEETLFGINWRNNNEINEKASEWVNTLVKERTKRQIKWNDKTKNSRLSNESTRRKMIIRTSETIREQREERTTKHFYSTINIIWNPHYGNKWRSHVRRRDEQVMCNNRIPILTQFWPEFPGATYRLFRSILVVRHSHSTHSWVLSFCDYWLLATSALWL